MKSIIDLTGQRFGHVTALEWAGWTPARNARWLVRCDCGGRTWIARSSNLRGGSIQSCGRAGCPYHGLRKHGHTHSRGRKRTSPEYHSWCSMKTRCLNTKRGDYPNYGGRGISVCPRWSDSFEAFLADMGPRPVGHSLDRINVNGDYEPGNARWATREQQQRNTRRAKRKLEARAAA